MSLLSWAGFVISDSSTKTFACRYPHEFCRDAFVIPTHSQATKNRNIASRLGNWSTTHAAIGVLVTSLLSAYFHITLYFFVHGFIWVLRTRI